MYPNKRFYNRPMWWRGGYGPHLQVNPHPVGGEKQRAPKRVNAKAQVEVEKHINQNQKAKDFGSLFYKLVPTSPSPEGGLQAESFFFFPLSISLLLISLPGYIYMCVSHAR
jgi:hypothetical protein